ncbi:hypothetical protein HHK36_021577 [Tetracentron sinense]|uniref:Myb/SANT-like DNA-binding domain-containing protein n=1 Tax=Tetracentron sinense TaxID=13715 RepID=A0A834YSE9_TETSI|nr:hypothetical protein HHK36_021577 [Tetracentron sinense]
MDDTEDDARYPPNPYPVNHQQSYGSLHRPKLPVRNASYPQPVDDYHRRIEVEESERHRKKRKLKNLALGYEFAPRVTVPSVTAAAAPKPSFGGRNSPVDWTEHATFVLLDAWGNRFLQLGRKSLRSEEWQEVAEKVSQASKAERTDTQCRNRLDTLKKKYKREKMKFAETGSTTSKWVYFKKMDMLMTSSPPQAGLSCGLDSGEYVFMNPRVYLNRSNGLDEMRDSPGNSESSEGDDDDSDGLPPKRTRFKGDTDEGSSFRLLADSIQKFGEIYEKIENSKRQQMLELEKMRMEFQRDLEVQKRQILERAQAEIAKIRQGDDEDIDISADNVRLRGFPRRSMAYALWRCMLAYLGGRNKRVFDDLSRHKEKVLMHIIKLFAAWCWISGDVDSPDSISILS